MCSPSPAGDGRFWYAVFEQGAVRVVVSIDYPGRAWREFQQMQTCLKRASRALIDLHRLTRKAA
jgi:hypothetical protein